jgi:tetratricopeptide (TPR) repeat protein
MSSYSSEEYVDRGRSLLGANKAQEALDVFEEGARRFPGDEDLLMGTAMALLKIGDAPAALGTLEELRTKKPRSEDVLEGLVEAALACGLPERATQAAREAVQASGTDAHSAYRLGRAFYGRGMYRESFPLYERAAALAPDWSEAWFGLGACEWAMKRTASAEAALRRAVELEPDDWQARQFLGCVLCDLGRKAEAKEMLESVPLDAPWQKPALERLVALAWWPTDAARRREMEALWRRVMGGAASGGALDVIEEVSRRMENDPSA